MKKIDFLFICMFFLIVGCSSWKNELVSKGDSNQAVENCIIDYLHSSNLLEKNNLFNIYIEDGSDYHDFKINDDVYAISISESTNKLLPTKENKIGTNHPYFPTRYIEKNNKLFFWYDSNSFIMLDIIDKLSKQNHIDSLNVNGFVGIPATSSRIDESKKSVHYYVCKNDLKKYKKVTTSISLGYYKPPKVKCIEE